MTGEVRVEPESSRRDRRLFLDLPYRLYRRHPVWVPPLRMAEAAVMDRAKNPFFRHAEVQHFLARRGDRVVGRIAAVENRLHNEFHGDRAGFFGFFDVEPDAEAASALVATARSWCAARGLSPMRGPVCYSTNDPCGVLVDGFERRPAILMPYNRPDYDALLRGAGLAPAKDLLALWMETKTEPPERFRRVVGRMTERAGLVLRPVDLRSFDREVDVLKQVYNRSWERNWGFVPATEAEFEHTAQDMKMLIEPDLSTVAERDGKPVGFCAILRDLNEVLARMNGRLLPFGIFRLLFGIKRIRTMRIIALGIVPEARGRALVEAFFLRAMDAARVKGYLGGEAGWILEDNDKMLSPIRAAGGAVTKRYRLYEG
jgi:hypothetical protein